MARRREITVNNTVICVVDHNNDDYISLTDMVRDMPSSNVIIGNWLRKKDTIEYLGLWEQLYNPDFKLIEFDKFKNAAGTNRFLESLNATLIRKGTEKKERYDLMREAAISQLESLKKAIIDPKTIESPNKRTPQ
ncbi:hypothetical protein DLD77_04540 [Chitinophaga alhagiae]|uniref:KilA/APSES-type HTH DNA-binding domain-containing protein n=1 Tax=Chitinophaga alhagiae TaxID=2203219 RepID=A0ABM6WDQ1_9BACT|nr:KilA-N domain-containing protein [Chitinophaga alhagiae]AWO02220.1 hypothetical protein DLD77_04540 [Chitinophaga alhagiae]